LGSRQFLLYLIPSLSTVPSAIRPLAPPSKTRTRALDVGAGVGRVTFDVLLPLVSDVVLFDPVEKFAQEAWRRALVGAGSSDRTDPPSSTEMAKWRGLCDGSKSVTVLQDALQSFDPTHPLDPNKVLGRLGYNSPSNEAGIETGFDIIWCQWCLGHLNDADLLAFFRRSRAALREREDKGGFIVVKENLCRNDEDGGPRTSFDQTDSSITR
jgi:protein N-terminal methyltransferase